METFASFGVGYLKYDWCCADITDNLEHKEAFAKMCDVLAEIDRPIVYGISEYGDTKPWTWAQDVANLWRTTHDINPSRSSILGIINSQAPLAGTSHPGAFKDPDMLQIGNGNLTLAENCSHFTMWSMLPTTPRTLNANAKAALVKLDSDSVVIAGGYGAVSSRAERDVRALRR